MAKLEDYSKKRKKVRETFRLSDFFLFEKDGSTIIPGLRKISDREVSGSVIFSDGAHLKVLVSSAKIMITDYDSLSSSAKKNFDGLISKNKRNFQNTLNTLYRALSKKS